MKERYGKRKLFHCSISYFLFLSVFLLGQGTVQAQDIQFRSEVDSAKTSLGSPIQLTFTVEGAQEVADIPLPALDGFEAQYLGPSTRITIINGRYSTLKSFVYSLLPLRTGRFTIPSVSITISGKSYATEPIDVEVTDSADGLASSGRQQAMSLEDKIALVMKVPRNEVYLYERLPVKIMLFVTDLSIADVRYPELKQAGFDIEQFEQPKQYEQIIKGIHYHIVEFNTNIYPTRVGEITLDPAALDCNIVLKSAGRQSPFGRGSVFDDDFFDSFFDRYEKRPMTVRSEGITLNVLPLPDDGKPKNFSGAVGRFNFEVSVSPTEVNEGDPVTLKMKVSGDGSLKAVQFPPLENAGKFKMYDPQVKEEGEAKTLEQVIIPQSDQITQVPALEFSYFDPRLKKYQVTTQGPFPLTVRKNKEEGIKIVGAEGGAKIAPPEVLGQDIIFIKDSPDTFHVIGRRFYRGVGFYVFLLFFLGAWAGLYGMYQRTHKIETDIAYARRLLAPKEAQKNLKEARRLMGLNQKEKFYDELFKTLQKYLGNKLHLSSGAVTFETVQSQLAGRITPSHLTLIKQAFEECDAIRYASAEISVETMRQSYSRIEQIIDYSERHLK